MLILQHSAELFAGMRCRRFPAPLPELPAALGCDADTPKQMAAPAQKQRCVNNRRSQKEKNNTATPRVTPVVCPSRRRQCHAAVLIREDALSCAVHHHQLLVCFHMKKQKNALACRTTYKMENPDCLLCLGSGKLTGTRKLTGAQKHALQMNSYARLHLQDNYTADISYVCICVHACVSECMCSVYSCSPKEKRVPLFIAVIYRSHHLLLKQSVLVRGSSQCEREPRLWKHHMYGRPEATCRQGGGSGSSEMAQNCT